MAGKKRSLRAIPLVLAGWLRYLIGIDDEGKPFTCSPDPLLVSLQQKLSGLTLGMVELPTDAVCELLTDTEIFGCDLFECGLAERVISFWKEMMAGPGAVRAALYRNLF